MTEMTATSLAVTRIERKTIDRELFIRRFIADDVDVRDARNRAEHTKQQSRLTLDLTNAVGAALRRARYHAERALDIAEKEVTDKTLAIDELKDRLHRLRNPTALMQKIRDIAESDKSEVHVENVENGHLGYDGDYHPSEVLLDDENEDPPSELKPLYKVVIVGNELNNCRQCGKSYSRRVPHQVEDECVPYAKRT
jgi:hypothetical protein